MMMRRQQSQEAPAALPLLHYQPPDTVTPPELFTSGAITPEPEFQDTVAPNSMAASPPTQAGAGKVGPTPQGLRFRASSVNETMQQQLRCKLSELVGQISREDMTSSEEEPIRSVGSREREKESEKLRKREREREMERNKKETDRASENLLERQTSRERVRSDTVRPRHTEKVQEREEERQKGVERQVEREKERRREMERLKREQARPQVTEGDTESVEMARPAEKELAQLNGPDLLEIEEVTGFVENPKDEATERGKESVEEANDASEDNLSDEGSERELMQRSKSERGSEKRAELESRKTSPDSSPCGPEGPTSPTEGPTSPTEAPTSATEVSRERTGSVGRFQSTESTGLLKNYLCTPSPLTPNTTNLIRHAQGLEHNTYKILCCVWISIYCDCNAFQNTQNSSFISHPYYPYMQTPRLCDVTKTTHLHISLYLFNLLLFSPSRSHRFQGASYCL